MNKKLIGVLLGGMMYLSLLGAAENRGSFLSELFGRRWTGPH